MKKILAFCVAIAIIVAIIFIAKYNINNSNVEYTLENVKTFSYSKYRDNDKYGVIDRNGKIVIEANYFKVEIPNPEKDLFICYESEDKSVVFNSDHQELFKEYNKVEAIKLKNIASLLCYEKSVLRYEKDGKYGLIDFNGKKVANNEYDSLENLQGTEGKFIVRKNDKYGVINLKGHKLIDTKYDNIQTDGYYSENTKYTKAGFIVSEKTSDGYRYGYLNYKGNKVLKIECNEIIRVLDKEEVYLIASKKGQYGLYNEKKEIIKPEYQSISYTDNGALIIQKNAKYGIVNLKGEKKVDTKYDQIEAKGKYLYAQNQKENEVYSPNGEKIDINFNKVVYNTENENYNIATLLNNNVTYYGIENKNGVNLVDMKYVYIEYIFKDYFIAEDEDEKYSIINANGKNEIDSKYDLIQKIKDKNIIQASNRDSKDVDFYSEKLEKVISLESARVENKDTYIKIFNEDETKYMDNLGNEITEDSDIIKNQMLKELPLEIEGFKKFQYSLDDAYYIK